MGDMSQASLVTDLKGILNDSASKFAGVSGDADADFKRHLDIAARDLGRVRPRTRIGSASLVADQPNYPAPADILMPKTAIWGTQQRRTRKPWHANYPGIRPIVRLIDGDSGEEIYLDPAPTAEQIADLGSDFKFYYFAFHSISTTAAQTTVKDGDRDLLLLRATAQAMTELAHHNMAKPVRLGTGGVGNMPKNGTPAALADQLMKLFERMAA